MSRWRLGQCHRMRHCDSRATVGVQVYDERTADIAPIVTCVE